MQSSPSADATLRVCVHLLDSSSGAIVQTWQFDGQNRITVGRSSERHVRVGDQHVSRLHAEMQYVDGAWMVESHGRNGLMIDGQRLQKAVLNDRSVFRLGPEGPALSVRFERISNDSLATIETDAMPIVDLRIDNERKQREVEQIAAGDYFQELRAKVRKIRGQQIQH
jgi:pSer/pThr/pTyr-binding forkhead associated (FHA) protein